MIAYHWTLSIMYFLVKPYIKEGGGGGILLYNKWGQ